MKLNEMRDRLVPEGTKLDIYFEVNEPLPAQVDLVVIAHYDDESGNRTNKVLQVKDLPCTPTTPRSNNTNAHAFTVEWTVNLAQDVKLAGRFVMAQYVVQGTYSPDWHGILAIDVTRQPELTRIMLHEFSKTDNGGRVVFDPKELNDHLTTLTVQQKRLLLNTALQYPNGRLVTFITLYPRTALRMNADWTEKVYTGAGVVPNATFSVFHCRNEARSRATPKATSPITLVCHTRYFVLNINNDKTKDWITTRVYDRRKPNQWLSKATDAPILFKIAALEPRAGVMSDGVMWHAIHHAASGDNIMPGNSVHGMINTVGCWMLFRNFNWPLQVTNELDRIYRKVYRSKRGKAAVVAELANPKAGYDVAPGSEMDGHSSSYDKFLKYDRNWAYQWFCHEVVGIKYFGHIDRWGDTKTVNDYNVHGRDMIKSFPLREADRAPAYNDGDEADYAYYDVAHHTLPIDKNLFRANALGFKTASAFVTRMDAQLSPAELAAYSWSDVYFFKEDGVNAERMTEADVKEP